MTSLDLVLDAARELHANHPDMRAYAPWPEDLTPTNLAANALPATAIIAGSDMPGNDLTQPLVDAVRETASMAFWKQTYSEEEVGADFLSRYGYYELFGPTGHYHTNALRGYIGFWGENLQYGWHSHEAEEIYLCLSGSARFHRGDGDADLTPGDTRTHESWQSHAMTTMDSAILTFVLWRGPGLADLPKMDQ